MELFTKTIETVRDFVETRANSSSWREDSDNVWPAGGTNIVLKEEMALELGSPEMDSLSCLLWTGDITSINDGTITLVGPDFRESMDKSLPFGKVVLLGVEGFHEDNAYDRHKELDFLRYDLDLKGFMMRAVSQYMREWCRVSYAALAHGFSIRHLGSELIRLFRRKPYVKAAEVIYFTSSTEDITHLRYLTESAEKVIAAMNKMAGELEYDCASCNYQDVCDEADGLRSMRDRLREKTGEARYV